MIADLEYLLQVESMWDVICSEKGRHQMSDWSGLSTVRAELESAQSKLSNGSVRKQHIKTP